MGKITITGTWDLNDIVRIMNSYKSEEITLADAIYKLAELSQ